MAFKLYIGNKMCSSKDEARRFVRIMLDFAPWGRFPSEVLSKLLYDWHPAYEDKDSGPSFFIKEMIRPDHGIPVSCGVDPWGMRISATVPEDPCHPRVLPILHPVTEEPIERYRVMAYPGHYRIGHRLPRDHAAGYNHQGVYLQISPRLLFVERSDASFVGRYFRSHGASGSDHGCRLCRFSEYGIGDEKRIEFDRRGPHVCDICGESAISIEWDHFPIPHSVVVRDFVMPLMSEDDIAQVSIHGQPSKLRRDHPARIAYRENSKIRALCRDCHSNVTSEQHATGALK